MTVRSPTIDRICAAAVAHFAERGYDGSSLNDIAEAVGIRKASLYAHFAGKDALFLDVFDEALDIETAFARRCFADERAGAQPGSGYCRRLSRRYAESAHLGFLLRTAYVPPQALVAQIDLGYERYLAALLESFVQRIEQAPETAGRLAAGDRRLYGQAYLAIVDSLHVKLVYTNGRQVSGRLKAMQRLLADSLQRTLGP
ncbi:TetR/AcrR family transcriptional regulator [Stenotrophomonas mori]|uniref:TetR/AcrR family transcriptional regulator n=1 Tax=Stenotrophomonas mori TaxID=2871096 RepID=A0ABT0SEU4_9GAMM|nr:TetR/AcrR family transcriptional regulator [Stenotrophomonas mori]MCL7713838.1 TetR/AcrR family transcriptional regulator [Stenotrophomonas mori]